MFLIKIFKFLKGYVIITLRGFFIERFINICTVRKIKLWDIKKNNPSFAVLKISMDDFKKIRSVARKTHTKVKIRKKCGLGVLLKKYKKRYAVFMGVIIFLLSCIILPRFIWVIEIDGTKTIPNEEVMTVLKDTGVYTGAYKRNLKTPQQIRDILMNKFDNITWAWIYINGSHALVKIEERAAVPEIVNKAEPGNIVALKDGVITDLTVKQGKACVEKGDAVLAGDVLITGEIEKENMDTRYVHSIGEAVAYTYYKEMQEVKLYEEVRTVTGEEKSFFTLRIPEKNINLFIDNNISYSEYDIEEKVYNLPFSEKYNIPVSLEKKTVKEVEVSRYAISEDMALQIGKETAENNISRKILAQSELTNEKVYTEKIDEETIMVYVEMEFKEKIGAYMPIGDIQYYR